MSDGAAARRGLVVQRGLVTAGGLVIVTGTFLPWIASGTARRSSYDVFELVDRLGHAPDGAFATAMRGWPLVPLLVTVAVVAVWSGRRRLAMGTGIVASLYSAGVAAAVFAVPETSTLEVLHGPTVTIAGAGAVGAGLLVGVFPRVRAGATAPATRGRRGAPLADRS